ncbi:retinal guanylyl cyclase 2 [Oopsacas minuta]|uniref:adenylate cyclase n=1 Tax=Oopsacas minuta TaxID=111878 RepID=A0AAV7KJ28_9METZ|nr:retinal guanylyl cyclase 2 [Oopsacas minuta]
MIKLNNCLRIKILGDCYYCVSGVPGPISNHADNCVNMGLDMCNTIKRFQRSTSPDLNMRVGVHSGHVFSGILGSKKFQFDIWSTDVTIANHMESGGVAGWVHISESTKRNLMTDFKMYNGNGIERDLFLKRKNVQTYFIKPEEQRIRSPRLSRSRFKSNAIPFGKQSIDMVRGQQENNLRMTERRATMDSIQTENEDTIDKQIKEQIEESLKRRSKQQQTDTKEDKRALFSIVDTHSDLNPYFLIFKDLGLEMKYHNVQDRSFKYYIISSWIVHLAIFVVQMIVHTSPVPVYFFIGGSIIMAILDCFYWLYLLQYVDIYPFNLKKIKDSLVIFSDRIVGNIFVRYLVSLVVIIIVMVSATINLATCCPIENSTFRHNLCNFNKSLSSVVNECPFFVKYFNEDIFGPDCVKCQNPQYFIYNAVLAMLVPSMFIGLNWIYKAVINTCGFIIYVTLYTVQGRVYFDQWDYRHGGICTDEKSYVPLIERGIYWILIEFLALVLFERVTERTNRIGFIWRHHSICKNEEHQQARDDHTHLLHNILPSHVAEHYLLEESQGNLYSHRHDNTCVMFASIPEFDCIYSEDDINHRGKEWIRLLNEMFHEFDMLLEKPEFAGVEKIKTIGSTYMAATGLKESDTNNDYHIYTMAMFSFALREKLKELSYNALNDFQFKIGINSGPVVAGVICAEKPLFDIWGDTVNVASRMESTGLTGETQVTKKVEIALTKRSLKLEHKGAVYCKGKGELDVYVLLTPEGYDI